MKEKDYKKNFDSIISGLKGSDKDLKATKVPDNLLNLIDEAEKRNTQEKPQINKYNFSFKNSFAVACSFLIIGLFLGNIIFQGNLNEQFRSVQNNQNYNDFFSLELKSENNTIGMGEKIPKYRNLKLNLVFKEKGKVYIKLNDKDFKEKLNIEIEKPYLFEIEKERLLNDIIKLTIYFEGSEDYYKKDFFFLTE